MPFLVEVRDAEVFLRGAKVLTGISWTMLPDEHWAVIGNNGSGKSTFLKLVFGELLPVYGGTVRWFGGRELLPLSAMRARVGLVSAEYQAAYGPDNTGLEVTVSGFFASTGLYAQPSPEQKEKAAAWMDFLGAGHLRAQPLGRMSYGEARRVLLARALVNDPELLILDEPCFGLDIPAREIFLGALSRLANGKTRLLYVTHHVEEVLPAITHVLYLQNGRIAGQGKKPDMLTGAWLSRALGCRISLQEQDGRYWVTGCASEKTTRIPAPGRTPP